MRPNGPPFNDRGLCREVSGFPQLLPAQALLAAVVGAAMIGYVCRPSETFSARMPSMRISAISMHGVAGWPALECDTIGPGVTVVYGPANTGKTTIAELIGHALYGKGGPQSPFPAHRIAPSGDVVVTNDDKRFRMRRRHDANGMARLTVASLSDEAVDQGTIRRLVGDLPPSVLAPLCALSFREPTQVSALLSPEFARGIQRLCGEAQTVGSRRTSELVARRDHLAHELETRIAGERQASKELDRNWRELDRLVRVDQEQCDAVQQRLKVVETSLAETDARLRYRRLELNVELRWQAAEFEGGDTLLVELDSQINQCRTMLSELSQRESILRTRLTPLLAARGHSSAILTEQQAWLAVARQLSADLAGEVARLARGTASAQCVCQDAHPRLRPIAETIERQLVILGSLIDEQRRSQTAGKIAAETEYVTRAQIELRRQLDQLLERRQVAACGPATPRGDANRGSFHLSAADAEQLESRRLELEQERFQLVEQLRCASRKLKELRGQRDELERQRAALLSARSIEHIQRELATVQQKLANATNAGAYMLAETTVAAESHARASDYLAQLTNGELTQLVLVENGRKARVVNRAGQSALVDSLSPAERDVVYLSLCLALLSAAAKQGIWLPLVLDEPFERLDAQTTAALAAVLDGFARQGQQVLVFTCDKAAAERLASAGAAVRNIVDLRQRDARPSIVAAAAPQPLPLAAPSGIKPRKVKRSKTARRQSEPRRSQKEKNGKPSVVDRESDAA
jgi:DNA repair exonuclease SbcCD ATPase subunit